MDYSKKLKKENDSANKPRYETKRVALLIFKIFLIGLVVSVFSICGATLAWILNVIDEAPDVNTIDLKPKKNYTTFIYDIYGNEIDRLNSNQGEARIYATLDEIPYYLQRAIVAIEDSRFYEHNGVDIRGALRAILANLKTRSLSEGASTITQQLIKNNVLTHAKTFERKIQEMYLALQCEQKYNKDLILEYYLNTLALGHGMNGVQSASDRYFNKDVSDLTLAECAILAGITQSPSRLSPVSNPEANWDKALIVLDYMEQQGYITLAEKLSAIAEKSMPILDDSIDGNQDINIELENISDIEIDTSHFDLVSANPGEDTVQKYINRDGKITEGTLYGKINTLNDEFIAEIVPHTSFIDAVIDAALRDLVEEGGMTETQANNTLYGGGVKIYTTFTPEIQSIVDKVINNPNYYPANEKKIQIDYRVSVLNDDGTQQHYGTIGFVKYSSQVEGFKQNKLKDWGITEDMNYTETIYETLQPQASFVIVDNRTGYIPALSGGRGEKYGSRTFNRATQATRQPGSTFKVLAAYAPALDIGMLSPGSVILDEPLTIEITPEEIYTPKNHDGIYVGPSTMRRGIWHSVNTMAVRTVQMMGLDTAYKYIENFGFRTLSKEGKDKVYALPLGGLTHGVTTLDLAGAYAALANKGVYLEPILYTKILDMDGNILFDNSPPSPENPDGHQNTHQVVSASTAYLLTDMMKDVIKIGTGWKLKNDFSSHPVAGKTGTTNDSKDLTFAGYTPYYTAAVWLGHDIPEELTESSTHHLTIWGKIMTAVHKDLPYRDFVPETTGYVKATVCSLSGMKPTRTCFKTHTDYLRPEHLITEYCSGHEIITDALETPPEVVEPQEIVEEHVIIIPPPTPEEKSLFIPELDVIYTPPVIPVIPEPALTPSAPITLAPDIIPKPDPLLLPRLDPLLDEQPSSELPQILIPELLPPISSSPEESTNPPITEDESEFFIP
ncbi:MAG: hypothetical protein ATN31_09340 [Candidatus Epulonipiscioides saccharophilum]|nr:MAG: hypothetical protein ATN31_09340 [Epulopiscium sp. AS2M-Bin001]